MQNDQLAISNDQWNGGPQKSKHPLTKQFKMVNDQLAMINQDPQKRKHLLTD